MEEKKNLEVVSGNGKDLKISPVYKHLETEKPSTKKPKNIVIPSDKNSHSKKKD